MVSAQFQQLSLDSDALPKSEGRCIITAVRLCGSSGVTTTHACLSDRGRLGCLIRCAKKTF